MNCYLDSKNKMTRWSQNTSILLMVFILLCGVNLPIANAEELKPLDIVSIDNNVINNVQNITFNDTIGHWAYSNIQKLVQKGAISGYPDGTFQPDRSITRAEFVTVLIKSLNIPAQSGKIFADTQSHWAKDAIATASSLGIASGISDSQFDPDADITREQMAVMIVSAAKLGNSQYVLNYADQTLISPWALQGVRTATEKKIFSGYPDATFRPQNTTTRAEAVTAIINISQIN